MTRGCKQIILYITFNSCEELRVQDESNTSTKLMNSIKDWCTLHGKYV
jgi:DNA phosphorothioation-dependent restriction protein DptG